MKLITGLVVVGLLLCAGIKIAKDHGHKKVAKDLATIGIVVITLGLAGVIRD